MRVFRNRREAGQALAARLATLRDEAPVVVGLPRGGVPVAAEVAAALDAPLDVVVVRKLGVPSQPELGMGAIGEHGVRVLNEDVVRLAGVRPEQIEVVEARERAEVERRARRFRGDRPAVPLRDRTVVVVDDGLATGGTARAAIEVVRAHGARRVVLAVPVAPPDTVAALARVADEVVCLESPVGFTAVGQWYHDFRQTTDEEVVRLLDEAAARRAARSVHIPAGDVALPGDLTEPAAAEGLVVFAHGSGSDRHSPRNRHVADVLQRAGFATLRFDLLTPDEAGDQRAALDVERLGRRLLAVTEWARRERPGLPIGYYGASSGAGAALWAAADPGAVVRAVVSRGGRPDLAGDRLGSVRAPTLLIVGEHDDAILGLNVDAADRLRCEHRIEIVPGASHLFEEPGALDTVARLAADWFRAHLVA